MAENTFQKVSITVETAHRLIAAAEKKATEMGNQCASPLLIVMAHSKHLAAWMAC